MGPGFDAERGVEGGAGQDDLPERRPAQLPPDTRPLPSVAAYDRLLRARQVADRPEANGNIDAAVIHILETCEWVKKGRPLCLIGDSGTGKSHLGGPRSGRRRELITSGAPL